MARTKRKKRETHCAGALLGVVAVPVYEEEGVLFLRMPLGLTGAVADGAGE